MRDFFHGWRRKVGCIALVLACVVTSAWIRNLTVRDLVRVSCSGWTIEAFSRGGWFYICWWNTRDTDPGFATPSWEVDTHPANQHDWHLLYLKPKTRNCHTAVHYCLLAIPLTLLAAYLLLWKSRKNVAITRQPETPHA